MQVHYDGEILTKVTTELNPGNGVPFVVIHFGKTRVFAESADDARAVIRAGIEALRLLDRSSCVLDGLRELAAECYAVNSDVPAGTEPQLPPPAPDDVPVCHDDRSPDSYLCTASRGHAGDHVAYGPDGEVYGTWPQDVPAGARGLVPQPAPDREGGCLT